VFSCCVEPSYHNKQKKNIKYLFLFFKILRFPIISSRCASSSFFSLGRLSRSSFIHQMSASATAVPVEAQNQASFTSTPPPPPFTKEDADHVQANYKVVEAKVKALLEERRSTKQSYTDAELPVRLVAVSKTKPAEAVQAAYDAGCRIFGENYVQEIVAKSPVLPKDIQWHMIGHLQSNKADEVVLKVPGLACVETVDSIKLANKLNKAVEKSSRKDKPLTVFVQVNTSGEDTKSGVEPKSDDLIALPKHIKENCKSLIFGGLMTIGMPDYTSRPENFLCLQECRKKVAEAIGVPELSLEMSMGMSGDYPQAIVAGGSTNVRVGSTIFGAREKKNMASLEAAAKATPEAFSQQKKEEGEKGEGECEKKKEKDDKKKE